jgi:CelD/BcsL family acetyltransferase involved in cellulose biosynthesis
MSKPPLSGSLARSFAELESLRESWDRLAMARPVPEVFHSFAWAQAWWAGYGSQFEVYSPVVRDARGEVVAIWPLVRRGAEIRAFGDGASDHNDLLIGSANSREALLTALQVLVANGKDWKEGVIRCVTDRGRLLEAARSIADESPASLEIFRDENGWAAAADEASTPFLRLARKETLRKDRKRLEKLGPIIFRHIVDQDEIRPHLAKLQRQHIDRWALRGIASHFLDEASKAYYAALLDRLPADGPLRFSVLEVNGRPVAYHLGFEMANRYVWYKPTFDVDYSAVSPGKVLLQSVFQYCDSAGIRELDFTIGDESYKQSFANVSYGYYQIHLFHKNSLSWRILKGRELVKRRNPELYHSIKTGWNRLNDRARDLRNALRRDGLFRFAGKRARRLVGAVAFRRDEVLLFRASHRLYVRQNITAPDMEVAPLRFSLLADAALRYPRELGPDRLQLFRERLAAGDRAVVALCGGRLAHIAWIGNRTAITAPETGPGCVLPLPHEAAVIYDYWTLDEFRGSGVFPAVLQSLLEEELRPGRDVWVYCVRENASSRPEILRAGFAESGRLVRTVLFGRIERRLVVQDPSEEAGISRP